jgi:hypothetical protein
MKNILISGVASFEEYIDCYNVRYNIKPQLITNNIIGIDAVLCIDHRVDDIDVLTYLNIPIYGMDRLKKMYQMMILDYIGINHPKTYGYYGSPTIQFEKIKDNGKMYVIKDNLGARGLGQAIGKLKDITNFLSKPQKYAEKLTFGNTKDDYNEREGYERYLYNNYNVIIQEKIDVYDEYRIILYYGTTPNIIKRIKSNNNWQSNSCIDENTSEICDNFDENILQELNKLLVYFNTPFLAVDLYIDNEGKWGLFEYQMEHGTFAFSNSYEKINTGVKNLIG